LDRFTTSLSGLTEQIQALWAAQNRTNRILAIGLLAVLIGAGGFAAFNAFRPPDYQVLFANLAADDASGVIAKLKDANIPYRTTSGDAGSTISIPAEKVAEERVALAGAGVVKGGGTGYELFDRTNLGMTDFQEKIAKTRANEGELQRTIGGLTQVESARVHIASPENSLYSTTQQPTTASVSVKMKPGMSLTPEEVRGITQLVAGAVEGLKPENVTIVNADGNILTPSAAPGSDALVAQASALKMTQDQLVAKQRYESNLQQNIQGLLDASIGSKRSAVRVSTDMNFDANQTETKSYSPQGTVRSQQNERESYNGTTPPRTAAQGVPATTTNSVPTYQGITGQQQAGRYNKSKNTVNYEITEENRKHIDAPGKVTRTSVAVLVDVPTATTTQNGQATYTVAAADVAKIRNVVAAAAGIDATRGDLVSVEAIPFAPPPNALGGRGTTTTIFGIPVPGLIAAALVLLLVGAGAGFLAYRRRGGATSAFEPSAEMPSFDSMLTDELPSFEEHPMLDGAPGISAPIRSAADLTREQMIEYVTTVAQENPDSIAKLVKLWLAE